MKQRPNISVLKNQKLINYVREKVLSDISGSTPISGTLEQRSIERQTDLTFHTNLVRFNTKPETPKITSKTKSKPIVNVQKRDIGKVNDFRIQMMNFANNELGIHPDLLIEEIDKYVLTITSYKLLSGIETPTAKDFDIYCNGLRLDVETYSVNVGQNIVITIQKSEAVDDHFDENNFEIVSKFDAIVLGLGDVDGDGEEDWLITENGTDIIK
jgi:GTP:adenosylcobinamide-phosphate guanylyltransferase